MDAATLDRLLTDSLLMETSDGLDHVAVELSTLHASWTRTGVEAATLDWLGGLIANLNWWSGRLIGGLSFVTIEQGVPDDAARSAVS